MGFKKRLYSQYKKAMKQTLKTVPNHEVYGCKPIFPPNVLLRILPDYIREQDFEACAAIKDVIKEWFEERGQTIPADALLKISEIELSSNP